jgi:hypothetical protein
LFDKRTGAWHDYRRRKLGEEIVAAFTLAPPDAPAWATDAAQVWPAVEAAELRKDSQVAHDLRIPVPFGLSDTQAIELATSMAQFIVSDLHTVVSVGLHRDADIDALGHAKPAEKVGYHAHLYFPTRRLTFVPGEDSGESGGQGGDGWKFLEKLTVLAHKKSAAVCIERMNQRWAELANEHATKLGLPADYTHLSYRRLGLSDIPQVTLGPAAVALERSGIRTTKAMAIRAKAAMAAPTMTLAAPSVDDPATPVVRVEPTPGAIALGHVQADIHMPKPAWLEPAHPIVVRRPDVALVVTETPTASQAGPRLPLAQEEAVDVPDTLATRLMTLVASADPNGAGLDSATRTAAERWADRIEGLLSALARAGRALMVLAQRRTREASALTEAAMELDAARRARAAARQAVRNLQERRTWLSTASKAIGLSPRTSAAQLAMESEGQVQNDLVQALKRTVARHNQIVGALDEEASPWLARQQEKQAKLDQAVMGLASLGPTLVPQLLAVATDEQRPWVATAAENISGRPADTAVETNPEPLPLAVLAESGRGGLALTRPRPSI